MPYPITTYNRIASTWNVGHTPAGNAPDHTLVPCQHYNTPHTFNYFRLNNPGGGAQFSGVATLIKFNIGALVFAQGVIIQPNNAVAQYYIVFYDQLFYDGFAQAFHGAWCIECLNTGALKYAYG